LSRAASVAGRTLFHSAYTGECSMATATVGAEGQATWLGHPKGLFVLFLTEMWERVSYYGMRSLLVLYMVNHLFIRPDVGASVLGFNALKGALEAAFGPLSTQALSSQVYGLYTGFVYFTPFFGGLLADRLLGRRKAVIVGGALMAAGQFLLAMENMFFFALMFLILGNGCFKPNISTQVGALYEPGDPRRDRAFSIFYVGINLGAFLAPVVCGTLGQVVGWRYGFIAAGVGMVIGLVFYLLNQGKLPVEPPPTASTVTPLVGITAFILAIPLGILTLLWLITLPRAIPVTLACLVVVSGLVWMIRLPKDERPRVMGLSAACLIVAAFWAVYEQQGNTLQLWADQNTHWPTILGFTIPSTWYQAFNPVMIWLLVPLLNIFWAWQSRRNQEPSSLVKMSIGCVLLGSGFIVMMAASHGISAGAQRSVLWLVGSTVAYTVGELYLSPIGLSFVTQVAPARIVSMMMGVWFLANFVGNYMTGYLGTFYEKVPHEQFFLMLCGIGVTAGIVLFAMSRPLNRIMGTRAG
jgi:proton-dependent oligopeptide transporter, POT family